VLQGLFSGGALTPLRQPDRKEITMKLVTLAAAALAAAALAAPLAQADTYSPQSGKAWRLAPHNAAWTGVRPASSTWTGRPASATWTGARPGRAHMNPWVSSIGGQAA
jgi:hypothetical protein